MTAVIIYICIAAAAAGVIAYTLLTRKHAKTSAALGNEPEESFIETAINKKRGSIENVPWGMKFGTYITIICSGVVTAYIAGSIIADSPMMTLILIPLAVMIPDMIIKGREKKERAKFEERYLRALTHFSASLKAGLTIPQAIAEITDSYYIHESVRKEFNQINTDITLGYPMKDAFINFAERVNSDDARDIASTITLITDVGGQADAAVDAIVLNISDRISTRKEIKTLFSGTMSMVTAMDLVPFLIVILMMAFMPSYFAPMFTSPAMTMIFWALIAVMAIGTVVTRRMANKIGKQ